MRIFRFYGSRVPLFLCLRYRSNMVSGVSVGRTCIMKLSLALHSFQDYEKTLCSYLKTNLLQKHICKWEIRERILQPVFLFQVLWRNRDNNWSSKLDFLIILSQRTLEFFFSVRIKVLKTLNISYVCRQLKWTLCI